MMKSNAFSGYFIMIISYLLIQQPKEMTPAEERQLCRFPAAL